MKYTITIIACLLTLTGCDWNVKHDPVYITKIVTPEDHLLVACDVQPPPDKTIYKTASMQERERLLVDQSSANMTNLFRCNNRLEKIRNWKKKEMELDTTNKLEGIK